MNFPQNSWLPFFQKHKILLDSIQSKLDLDIKSNKEIYPSVENRFRAFDLCDLENLKVVILGQDPYHGEGEANGLCFSVNEGVKIPPSLRNIFKELALEFNEYNIKRSTDLSDWAEQGVLLLNSILTVEKDIAASHSKYGWQEYTDAVISEISYRKEFVIFIFLGNYAQSKIPLIDQRKHTIIKAVHPSPLSASRGFFGSNVFKNCNLELEKMKLENIIW
jgi:uracil-DNA glycosylase